MKRSVGAHVLTTFLLGSVLVGLACQASPVGQPLRLDDGRPLEALVGPDTTIVVLYDPADCLRCDPNMLTWHEVRGRDSTFARVVLARVPTSAEAEQIALMGYDFDGMLEAGASVPPMTVARLYVGGVLVSEEGVSSSSPILRVAQEKLR